MKPVKLNPIDIKYKILCSMEEIIAEVLRHFILPQNGFRDFIFK